MIEHLNGALLLNQRMFHTLRNSPHVILHGMKVLLLVGLIVGGVRGAQTMLNTLNPEQSFAQARDEIETSLNQQALQATTTEQREAIKLVRENLDPAIDLLIALNNLPTPLSPAFAGLAQGLGVFVSQPLAYLSSLLLTVILTHIAAFWLGGNGTLQQMIGLSALSFAPNLLDALAFVPYIGGIFGFIAWVWGLTILILATSVAHEFDSGKATLAVLFFPLIGIVLGFLLCCAVVFLSLSLAAGSV